MVYLKLWSILRSKQDLLFYSCVKCQVYDYFCRFKGWSCVSLCLYVYMYVHVCLCGGVHSISPILPSLWDIKGPTYLGLGLTNFNGL